MVLQAEETRFGYDWMWLKKQLKITPDYKLDGWIVRQQHSL
jgi:hypothetical protein